MKIQIQIVTWNSKAWINNLLVSIRRQTRLPDRVLIIDNGSTDGTLEALQTMPGIVIKSLNENTGFSVAHNIGFRMAKNYDAVFCLNPDIILQSGALELLEKTLTGNSKIGSISPMLVRERLTKGKKISIVDCAGIERRPTFSFKHIHENDKVDLNSKGETQTVFANSGAAVLYRVKALCAVGIHRQSGSIEYFDEDFFAYKEDIDMGWRLLKKGWLNVVDTSTTCFHERTIKKEIGHIHFPAHQLFLSYRNHLLLLLKNCSLRNFLLHGFLIIPYELGKFVYLLLTRPKTVANASMSFFKLAPIIYKKRSTTL
jgi:GT2 family glycosyltransferase